jgi:VanZ family protein
MNPSQPLRIALFALACTGVLAASLVPVATLPSADVSDKVEHFVAYAGLALLGAWAFTRRLSRVTAGLIAGGVGIEILQATMPFGRQGDAVDALANSLGVALGMGLALLVVRARR